MGGNTANAAEGFTLAVFVRFDLPQFSRLAHVNICFNNMRQSKCS